MPLSVLLRWAPAVVLGLAALSLSCAPAGGQAANAGSAWSAPSTRDEHAIRIRFPSEKTLDAIRSAPVPAVDLGSRARIVDAWALTGPLAERFGQTPAAETSPSPWVRALLAHTRKTPHVVVTEEMSCAAREAGLFITTHELRPSATLMQFMTSRCGAVALSPTSSFIATYDDPGRSDAEMFAAWEALLGDLLVLPAEGQFAAGIWFGRHAGRMAIVFVLGEVAVEIAEVTTDPSGAVTVAGTLLERAERARALISRGLFDVGACAFAPGLHLPAFRMTCSGSPGDAMAWVEMITFTGQRPMGTGVLRIPVSPTQGLGGLSRFQNLSYGPPQPVVEFDDRAAMTAAVVEAVNRVRGQAGRVPLALAKAQSEVMAALAPFYFHSLFDRSRRDQTDTIVLGLMAGWRVPGLVQSGWFTSIIAGEADIGELVSEALASPFGRDTLLGPNAVYIAVGPIRRTGIIGAIMATYQVGGEVDQSLEREHVWQALSRARKAKGRGSPAMLAPMQKLAEKAAVRIGAGTLAPAQARYELMVNASQRMHRRAHGWALSAHRLEHLVFPPELVTMASPAVAVAVALVRQPDQAWAHYVVLLVAVPQ